jgi:hypothetical protein
LGNSRSISAEVTWYSAARSRTILNELLFLYRKLKVSDTTEGLLRGKRAFPLKGDSERSERQRDEVPMDKIVRERKRTPILRHRNFNDLEKSCKR